MLSLSEWFKLTRDSMMPVPARPGLPVTRDSEFPVPKSRPGRGQDQLLPGRDWSLVPTTQSTLYYDTRKPPARPLLEIKLTRKAPALPGRRGCTVTQTVTVG